MRKLLFLLFLVPGLLLAQNSQSQGAQKPAGAGDSAVSGRWIISADFYGTPINFSLELKQEGDKLTGNFEGDKLEGTLTGNSIHCLVKDEQGGTEECQATVQDGVMSGTVVLPTQAMRRTP
jgi:amidase